MQKANIRTSGRICFVESWIVGFEIYLHTFQIHESIRIIRIQEVSTFSSVATKFTNEDPVGLSRFTDYESTTLQNKDARVFF